VTTEPGDEAATEPAAEVSPPKMTEGAAIEDTASPRKRRASLDPEVPRLPRGKGIRVTHGQLFKIILTAAVLVMLVVVQRPCADSVSKFVTGFGDEGSSAKANMPKPGNVDVPAMTGSGNEQYEEINSDMTEAQLKAAIERSRARARALAGSGSGSGSGSGGSGSGSSQP